ncbi:SRPBCC domain-containing protein [Pelagerythrobacter marensis]|uniref:SRPBCC domain-containing protein n=1 Tax=Pelagerythrobacter marensis TaxID=543877 RepID=A0ABZ2D4U8_9SPHN
MTDETFDYTIYIDASVERVFEALTNPDKTAKYWAGRRITTDWRPGSPFHLYIDDTADFEVFGEVIACEAPNTVSYTWNVTMAPDAPPSTVKFRLQPTGHDTKLTLTHAPLAADDMARQGWPAILSSLKTILETGRPMPGTDSWRRKPAAQSEGTHAHGQSA